MGKHTWCNCKLSAKNNTFDPHTYLTAAKRNSTALALAKEKAALRREKPRKASSSFQRLKQLNC